MSQLTSDGLRGAGRVFRAKSLWLESALFLLGAAVGGGVALELGLDPRARALLGATPETARLIAWLVGGVAALVALGVCWEWYGALRWVAVGPDGLRWYHGGRVLTRAWNEIAGVQRKANKVYLNGQHISTAHGAEVQFHRGAPLVLSPLVVPEYESLLAAIEYGSRRPTSSAFGLF
jgi:hypothetical protein